MYSSANTDDILDAMYGATPEIDGTISSGEWTEANYIQYAISDGILATVYFMEDGERLYVAFDIPTPEHDQDDSGIMIDVDNDGGSRPQRNDFVFQQRRDGSEKREHIGTGFNWLSVPPNGWTEETSTTETGWQIEYSIGFSKIGIFPNEPKTIGIGFHIWDDEGEYDWPENPCYNVPDRWGDMASSDNWYIIETPPPPVNQPPTAIASADVTSGYAPLTVLFTGMGMDSDGTIVSYQWHFAMGDIVYLQNTTHTFEQPGTYEVVLKVTDDDGATDTDSLTIAVKEKPPDENVEPPAPDDNDQDDVDVPPEDSNDTAGFEAFLLIPAIVLVMAIMKIKKHF